MITRIPSRIIGKSSKKVGKLQKINKGVLQVVRNENCPPLAIEANEIKHDKQKRDILQNAFLKIYNVPVYIFLNFFHPDPIRKEDLYLKPVLNDSNVLGSSLTLPYYKFYQGIAI